MLLDAVTHHRLLLSDVIILVAAAGSSSNARSLAACLIVHLSGAHSGVAAAALD